MLRMAQVDDASALLEHLAAVSVESDFLTFGPGELELNVPEEEGFIRSHRESPLKLLLLAFVDNDLVGLRVGATAIVGAWKASRVQGARARRLFLEGALHGQ
jgi:hypothetical protein